MPSAPSGPSTSGGGGASHWDGWCGIMERLIGSQGPGSAFEGAATPNAHTLTTNPANAILAAVLTVMKSAALSRAGRKFTPS